MAFHDDHDEPDLDDLDIDELRGEAEREALRVGLSMLRSDGTPATARASVVRAILGDAAARRHDDGAGGKASHEMNGAELAQALRALKASDRFAWPSRRAKAIELKAEAVAPDPAASVFD